MGYAIAKAASQRGANVTLVTGAAQIEPYRFVETVPVTSAREMFEAVVSRADYQDMIIKAAAVADYRPVTIADNKIKKQDNNMNIALERTDDILKYLGEHRRKDQILCGFSMETEHMLENSRAKLAKKNLDVIVANNVKTKGAGFGVDTNVVTIISKDHEIELPLMSKEEVANQLLDFLLSIK